MPPALKSVTAKAAKGCKRYQHALRERTLTIKPAGESCRARGRRSRLQMMPKWCPGPASSRLGHGTAARGMLGADGADFAARRERAERRSTSNNANDRTTHATSPRKNQVGRSIATVTRSYMAEASGRGYGACVASPRSPYKLVPASTAYISDLGLIQ